MESQIQVPFQVCTVNDVDDQIGVFEDDKVVRDNFFFGIRGQRIDAGQINNVNGFLNSRVGILLDVRPRFFLNGHARPVADLLVGFGQAVEKSRFAAVRVSGKSDCVFCQIRHLLGHPREFLDGFLS